MESFQLQNLKSIVNSGKIDLKPITVFVGKNSSGKSSIIRCFPLLKQSLESKILGTILWSGKYVDYGSFDESLNDLASAETKEISFSFVFSVFAVNQRSFLQTGTSVTVTISVHGDEYTKNSYTNIDYEMFGSTFSMRVNSDLKILSLSINGTDYSRQASEAYRAFKNYSIVPLLFATGARSSPYTQLNRDPLAEPVK